MSTTTHASLARTMGTLMVGAALALGALAMGGCAAGAQANAGASNTITVTGRSSVEAVPNIARITVAIVTEGDNAAEAQKANGKPTKAVIASLKELGVSKEQIQTSYTDLSPLWTEDGKSERYQMRTTLEIKGLPIETVSEVMEACVDAGATEVSGPDYYADSYDELYQQALTEAVEATRTKAEAIAEASHVSLGKIVSVSEGYQDTSLAFTANAKATEESATDGLAGIEPGEVSVSAEVTVSYEIR